MSQYPPQVGPIPVQPLYATPMEPSRPGIITAIGVVSIVVASLSLLGGILTAFWSIGFLMVSAIGSGAAATPPPLPPAPMVTPATQTASTAPSLRVSPTGFDDDERATVLDAMENVRPLSDGRHKQLDRLLAKCGKQIFPIGNLNVETAVKNAINDSGQSLSATDNGPDYFVLARGRIEVNDDRALFDPLDGGEKVRVSDDEPDDESNGLSVPEIDAVVKRAQQMSGQKLTPPQLATLTKELQDPNQTLLTSTNKPAKTAAQVATVTVQPDGSAMFQTRSGFVQVAQNGALLFSTSSATAWARGAGGRSPFKVNAGAAVMAMSDAIGGLLLAILLLIAGIVALRQSPRARRLHLIYACIKMPLIIIGLIGWWWLAHDMMASFSQAVGGGGTGATKTLSAVITAFGIVACIYPIALLIVLNTRGVREYYSSAR